MKSLREQKRLAGGRSARLFSVFAEEITADEIRALEFLYSYLPLSDLASHDGFYYLENVRASLDARKSMPWGTVVPDDLFFRYVLFCRINNENMDASRMVFYRELRERVQELPMKEAVLEINHWCHERVTYRPTDIRTESPLAVIRTAFGRCGEESTFTVAALRSVCIPARQVYSPRWAHCDDNHAWVEAWAEGEWHFLGACEPAPDLDMGWFKEPARRAMLITTKVPGGSTGGDEVVRENDWFAEINLLSRYAETKKITVLVLDEEGNPVPNAVVKYRVYNSASFVSIAGQNTAKNGTTALSTGLGDLLVHACKGSRFGYRKISVADTDTVEIVLNRDGTEEYTWDLDMASPLELSRRAHRVSEEEEEENKQRLREEDGIRARYESSFMNREQAATLAEGTGLDPDRVWKFIETSRGNWQLISDYLRSTADEFGGRSLDLLETLAEKDLRDIEGDTLIDHLTNSASVEDMGLFNEYVLAPRIRNELLVPYKGYLQSRFSRRRLQTFRDDPVRVVRWVKRHIAIVDEANGCRTPLTPIGVYELKKADSLSRDIFFVALCRSMGIPSRLEPAGKSPQYFKNREWVDVDFAGPGTKDKERGYIDLHPVGPHGDAVPEYSRDFSISRLSGGEYQILDYEDTKLDAFTGGLPVETGSYVLVTGNRLPDGTALSRSVFFTVKPGETKRVPFEIRAEAAASMRLGTIDGQLSFRSSDGDMRIADLCRSGGLVVSWTEANEEPTRHFIRDLERLSTRFDQEDAGIVILGEEQKALDRSGITPGKALPMRTIWASDDGHSLLDAFGRDVEQPIAADFPVVIILDTECHVVFVSLGYRIGVGEQILKVLKRMRSEEVD